MSGSSARIEYARDAFRRRTLSTAKTVLEYHSKIDIDETAPVIRSVGIICTIGMFLFWDINFLKTSFKNLIFMDIMVCKPVLHATDATYCYGWSFAA